MKKVVLLVKTLAVVLLLTLAALLFRGLMPAWPSTLLGKEEGTAKGQIRVSTQLRKKDSHRNRDRYVYSNGATVL